MSKAPPSPVPQLPAPQLYATLEIRAAKADAAEAALKALLAAAPVASLLLAPGSGHTLEAGLAKSLVALAQKRGVAVLIADDARLARMIKADGVHVSWSKDVVERAREAREIAGQHALIGADAGRSRDDAMQLGEDGVDYVAFGIPAHVEDRATAEHRQLDLVMWWSEIFEVPCVAFDVATLDGVCAFAGSGAEFVNITVVASDAPDAIARAIADAASALQPVEATA